MKPKNNPSFAQSFEFVQSLSSRVRQLYEWMTTEIIEKFPKNNQVVFQFALCAFPRFVLKSY